MWQYLRGSYVMTVGCSGLRRIADVLFSRSPELSSADSVLPDFCSFNILSRWGWGMPGFLRIPVKRMRILVARPV